MSSVLKNNKFWKQNKYLNANFDSAVNLTSTIKYAI